MRGTVAPMLVALTAGVALGNDYDLLVPPDYRARQWEGFRKAMATGDCKSDGAATNLPVLCKDGTARLVPARFVFLSGRARAARRYDGDLRDPRGWRATVRSDHPL